MTKKLDFDLKVTNNNEYMYFDGKPIFKGNDKSKYLAEKLKEVCKAVDELMEHRWIGKCEEVKEVKRLEHDL